MAREYTGELAPLESSGPREYTGETIPADEPWINDFAPEKIDAEFAKARAPARTEPRVDPAKFGFGKPDPLAQPLDRTPTEMADAAMKRAPAEAKVSPYDFDTRAKFKDSGVMERGLYKGANEFNKFLTGVAQFEAELIGADKVAQRAADATAGIATKNEAIGTKPNVFEANLEGAISSLTSQAPTMIASLGLATGARAFALSNMGVQSLMREFGEGRRQKLDFTDAMSRAVPLAAGEVVGESFAVGPQIRALRGIFRGTDPSQLSTLMARAILADVPGEQLTKLNEVLIEKSSQFGLNKEAGLADYIDQVRDTFLQTMMQGGLMFGGGHVINRAVAGATGKIDDRQSVMAATDAQREAEAKAGAMFAGMKPAAPGQAQPVEKILPEQPMFEYGNRPTDRSFEVPRQPAPPAAPAPPPGPEYAQPGPGLAAQIASTPLAPPPTVTASKLEVDPDDVAGSIAAIAAAPVTPINSDALMEPAAGVAEPDHTAAAGDLAALALRLSALDEQLKSTPKSQPEILSSIREERASVQTELSGQVAQLSAQYGEAGANAIRALATRVFHEGKNDITNGVRNGPVPGSSTAVPAGGAEAASAGIANAGLQAGGGLASVPAEAKSAVPPAGLYPQDGQRPAGAGQGIVPAAGRAGSGLQQVDPAAGLRLPAGAAVGAGSAAGAGQSLVPAAGNAAVPAAGPISASGGNVAGRGDGLQRTDGNGPANADARPAGSAAAAAGDAGPAASGPGPAQAQADAGAVGGQDGGQQRPDQRVSGSAVGPAATTPPGQAAGDRESGPPVAAGDVQATSAPAGAVESTGGAPATAGEAGGPPAPIHVVSSGAGFGTVIGSKAKGNHRTLMEAPSGERYWGDTAKPVAGHRAVTVPTPEAAKEAAKATPQTRLVPHLGTTVPQSGTEAAKKPATGVAQSATTVAESRAAEVTKERSPAEVEMAAELDREVARREELHRAKAPRERSNHPYKADENGILRYDGRTEFQNSEPGAVPSEPTLSSDATAPVKKTALSELPLALARKLLARPAWSGGTIDAIPGDLLTTFAGAIKGALDAGVPANLISRINGFHSFTSGPDANFVTNSSTGQISIGIRESTLRAASTNERRWGEWLIGGLIHELGHLTSFNANDQRGLDLSGASPLLAMSPNVGQSHGKPTGEVLAEGHAMWESGDKDLADLFAYPFNWLAGPVGNVRNGFFAEEFYAQSFTLYYTNPELMREKLPLGFALQEKINELLRAVPSDGTGIAKAVGSVLRGVSVAGTSVDAVGGAVESSRARDQAGAPDQEEAGAAGDRPRVSRKRKAEIDAIKRTRSLPASFAEGQSGRPGQIETGANELLITPTRHHRVTIRRAIEQRQSGQRPKRKILEVALDFDRAIARTFGGPLDPSNPEHFARAVRAAVAEVNYQLGTERSGLNWYDEDIGEAFRVTETLIPELKQEKHRQLFTVIAALMSPQSNARDNWVKAAIAYRVFLDTGAFPPFRSGGQLWTPTAKQQAKLLAKGLTPGPNDNLWSPSTGWLKVDHIRLLNAIIADKGLDNAVEWFMSPHTIRELRAVKGGYGVYATGKSVAGRMNDVQLGITIFGPKVGPFMLNLNGISTEVTVDVWMTRTFQRYFGRVVGSNGEMKAAPDNESDRELIKQLVREVASETGHTHSEIQAVLWFFEQQLYKRLGGGSKSYHFSDGARLYAESAARAGVRDDGPVDGQGSGQPAEVAKGSSGDVTRVQPGDFARDPASALARPGWFIVTGTTTDNPNSAKDINANMALKAELRKDGVKFETVQGMYRGDPQGESYIVYMEPGTKLATETQARAFGEKYKQETILTNRGFIRMADNMVLPADVENPIVGPDALKLDNYSVLPDGTAFSSNLPEWKDENWVPFEVARESVGDRESVVESTDLKGDGRVFTNFFTETSEGKRAPNAKIPYKPVLDIRSIKDFSDAYTPHRGNFDDHIATSIPGFREVQQAVGDAIVKTYANHSRQGSATLLDIAASEGAFNKAITSQSDGKIFTLALDPNLAMAKFFAEHSQVEGADYDIAAFGSKEDEGKIAWTEDDGTKIKYFKPVEKYDIVHEAMGFQFISNTRNAQFARVKELMEPNGIALFEEKIKDDSDAWRANEKKKDAYKAIYYTAAQIEAKAAEVLDKGAAKAAEAESEREQAVVGMNDLMTTSHELETSLTNNWKHVVQYWDSGNFKGYVASDDPRAISRFLGNLVDLNSEFSTVATPRAVNPDDAMFGWEGSRAGSQAEIIREAVGDRGPTFYSALERAIGKAPYAKDGTIQSEQLRAWLASRTKDGTIRNDEVFWSGLEDYLKTQTGRVRGDNVAAFIKANGVQIKDVVLGEAQPPEGFYLREMDDVRGRWNFAGMNINTYGATPQEAAESMARRLERDAQSWQKNGDTEKMERYFDKAAEIDEWLEKITDGAGGSATKFASYQLPGGTNYRELLLTLPDKRGEAKELPPGYRVVPRSQVPRIHDAGQAFVVMGPAQGGGQGEGSFGGGPTREAAIRAAIKVGGFINEPTFSSSHFDQPNILAHIRFNDRTSADGKRVLFIEEIQSDWAQKGRRVGVRDEAAERNARAAAQAMKADFDQAYAKLQAARDDASSASQRIIRSMGLLNYSSILTHDDRAELTAEYKKLQASDPAYVAANARVQEFDAEVSRLATLMGGTERAGSQGDKVPAAPFVGRTEAWTGLALKRMIRYGAENGYDSIAWTTGEQQYKRYPEEDPNSDVGKHRADGMRGYYDKIVPQVANGILKRLGGGKVGEVSVSVKNTGARIIENSDGKFVVLMGEDNDIDVIATLNSREQAQMVVAGLNKGAQPGFDITDTMRDRALEGQELFREARGDEHGFAPGMTPAQKAALEHVGILPIKTPLSARLQTLKKDAADRLVTAIVDQFHPLKALDPTGETWELAMLSKATSGGLEAIMRYGNISLVDRTQFSSPTGGKGFRQTLKDLRGEEMQFLAWVAANRAEMLMAEGREHLFTRTEIAEIQAMASGNMKDGRNRLDAYKQANEEMQAINRQVLDLAEDSGMIDPDSRSTWEKDFYLPFYRVLEDDPTQTIAIGKGRGLVGQQAFQRLKGGTDKLASDLLGNIERNWSHILDASARNRAAQSALDWAEATGAATKVNAPEKGSKFYMERGVKQHYLVTDQLTLTAITGLERIIDPDYLKWLTIPKKMITIGATADPTFVIRNGIRDTMSAIAQSEISLNIFRNTGQGLAMAVNKNDPTHAAALAAGGIIHFGTMTDGNQGDYYARLVREGTQPTTIFNRPEKAARWLWNSYSDLRGYSEDMNRLSLIKQMGEKGASYRSQMVAGRNLLNFTQSGAAPVVQFLIKIVPFLNAGIQGLYRISHPSSKARFAVVLLSLAAAEIALNALYADDDDWKKRKEFDRQNYFWFKVGDVAYRIPKPFEIGSIATLAGNTFSAATDDEMDAKRYWSGFRSLLANSLRLDPTPQLLRPIMDVQSNVDFSGGHIESQAMEGLPKSERYGPHTTDTAKLLGQLAPAQEFVLGKGNALSPVQIDSLARGYFGWLGTMALVASDAAVNLAQDKPPSPDWQLRDVPVVGKFVETVPTNSSRYSDVFYDQATAIREAYTAYNAKKKAGDKEGAAEWKEQYGDLIKLQPQVARYSEMLALDRAAIRRVEQSRDLDGEEKREKLDALYERMNRTVEKAARATAPQ